MNRMQSFHKETALIIAQQMTRDATIDCMRRFNPVGANASASGEDTYHIRNDGSVTVECHFDGLHVVIAWYDAKGTMLTREQAINAIAGNICSMTS